MASCLRKYDQEIKVGALRLVREHLPTYGSVTRAADAAGPQLGISGNTLRRWVVQADVDDGVREGVPSEVQAELARLTSENKRLPDTNEILRRASLLFAWTLHSRARCAARSSTRWSATAPPSRRSASSSLPLLRWPHSGRERDGLVALCAAGARRFAREQRTDAFTGR